MIYGFAPVLFQLKDVHRMLLSKIDGVTFLGRWFVLFCDLRLFKLGAIAAGFAMLLATLPSIQRKSLSASSNLLHGLLWRRIDLQVA